MAASPITASSDILTFSIKSNGTQIRDTYQVVSVYIENNINTIPYCVLEILDGSAAKEDFPISDSETFVPGAKIEVWAGYENKDTPIFKGMVTKHSLSVKERHGPTLRILCMDEAVKMTVARKNAYFTDTTDSDIISNLIRNNGLSADVTSTPNSLKEVIQYYATDWDFMISRAEFNGLVVSVKDGTVSVKNPDNETEEVLTLTYGMDIYELDANIDAEHQYKSVQSKSWDYKTQSVHTQSASTSNFDIGNLTTKTLAEVIGLDNYPLQTAGFTKAEELNTWAKGQVTKSKYAKARGYVKFQGSALAEPGKLIELKGLGDRFNGKAFVSGIVHEISNGNWLTTSRIGLSPEWYTTQVKTEAPLASGLLPGIQGLSIGKVKKISSDPDGEFRVLVSLPLINSSENGVWARFSSLYASKASGAFFYPEIDDEVIVGFINDDPRYPIILGSVYSSNRNAPTTPDNNNNIKEFVSREKLKITFNEENKDIYIETPKGNKVTLSDQSGSIELVDNNKNKVTLDKTGITLDSAKDIILKAKGNVEISAGAKINLDATADVAITGLNINNSAKVGFVGKGNATAELSAAGQTVVKGAMVMIN